MPYHIKLSPVQNIIKRILDIVVSFVILILTTPIVILSAILIKLDSPGPVLYEFVRYAPDGTKVTVTKFRTMRFEAEKSAIVNWAISNDPRISRVGAFLRQTAIDEIPQLFCVLQGKMSLVGPRPKHIYEYERYKEIAKPVVVAKPGITFGSRSTSVSHETTMSDLYEEEKLYIENWSLWADLKIIIVTVKRSFCSSNAR